MGILLQVDKLAKSYGGQKIFSDLSFTVYDHQKIGVIGRNGAGKSTLFKILINEENADSGRITVGKSTIVGYLRQNEKFVEAESAFDYLRRHGEKEDWQIRKLASKFQIDLDKLNMPASSFSGGWGMRLKLCAALLVEPNLFLLDEPTNYLDLNTLLLLEKYLKSYNASLMIISHDREFLKKTCNETLEVSKNGCYHYAGGIESYLEFKEQKLSTAIKANNNLDKQQENLQEYVDRYRYKAAKAKQAQSVIRRIKKLEGKRIGIEHSAGIVRFGITPCAKRYNFVLKTSHLSIGYGEKVVADDIDVACRFGEKVAILGLNGQGKSTFIKTLVGELPALTGSFRFASNIKIAHHDQVSIESLDDNDQVGTYLRSIASSSLKTEAVLRMAGNFLFRDDELKKPIGVLSGGERSRLLLAGLLLSAPDVFILDEPTCHLDFETAEALALALKKFNGTVFFASHDRTFSSIVATALIEVKNGSVKRRSDDYQEYVDELEHQLGLEDIKDTRPEVEKEFNREQYLLQKENQKKMRSLERDLEKLRMKERLLNEYFLANTSSYDYDKIKELAEIQKEIAAKEDEWLLLVV
ncbi:MAG: ABC-F family ATP-binding cassette domain-containing protein [Candidatus Falkowbacteria bacterium]